MELLKPERPLTEEPLSAVLARVAFAVAVRRYWRPIGKELPEPSTFVSKLAQEVQAEGWPVLHSWLLSMAYYSTRGLTAARWRSVMVQRARIAESNRKAGRPWQRVPPCY